MKFSRADLAQFRGATMPDLIGPGTKLLFVGFNPGLRSVAVGAPFSMRSNRFWPALYASGILDRDVDARAGLNDRDRAHILDRGVGITSLVEGATARASELSPQQLRAGAGALGERVRRDPPNVVAILGITAYRLGFEKPAAQLGLQDEPIAGVPCWVVPNPSGLNAHASLSVLAATYREAAIAAGIDVFDPVSR
jgi:TDG/mug DNA glycosylase family protein